MTFYEFLDRAFPRDFTAKAIAAAAAGLLAMGIVGILAGAAAGPLVLGLVVGVGVAGAGLWALCAPLEKIANNMDAVLDRQAVDRLPETHRDQLGRMMRGLNLLMDGLEQRLELATASADRDDLTGLLNMDGFARLAGDDVSGAIFYMDLDSFDGINRRFGKAAGNIVLREFARVVEAVVRDNDLVARVSGEEFLVYLKGAPESAARRVSERIRSDVETRLRVKGQAVTVSIGIALSAEPSQRTGVVGTAKAAMEMASKAGGNQVTFSEEEARAAA